MTVFVHWLYLLADCNYIQQFFMDNAFWLYLQTVFTDYIFWLYLLSALASSTY